MADYNAVEVQKASLQAAQAHWNEESAHFDVTSYLSIYDTNATKWYNPPPGTNISSDALTPPHELYALVTATNQGRFSGGIKEIGFYKDKGQQVPLSSINCFDSTKPTTKDCPLPLEMGVAASMQFYLPIGEFIKTDFQCNDYLKQGIRFYVKALDGTSYDSDSHGAVSSSSYCPTVAPKQP